MAVKKDFLIDNFATRIFENSEGFFVEKLYPNVFQYFHCTFVDGQNTFVGQWFDGTICIFNNAPRHLLNGASVPAGVAGPTAAAASWCIAHFGLHQIVVVQNGPDQQSLRSSCDIFCRTESLTVLRGDPSRKM